MIDRQQFEKPEAKYRAAPFWAWNHDVVPERLVEQIRSMHEQGLGGYYMHSRAGLKTQYLGEEWAKAIEACIREGEKLGMFANLYDEDCWPSGNAAGMVTKDHPEFAAQSIVLREGAPADYVAPDGKGYRFDTVVSRPSPRWGSPSPDTMSKAAMARFIETTHEWYKARFGQHFGKEFSKVVPTMFADEPNISFRFARMGDSSVLAAIPWSVCFEEEFISRKGYNVRDVLAQMFFDIPGYEKTRFDFYDVAGALFREAFTKQIYDWCEKNNIDFTCHYWEHTYPIMIGQGDVMAHYEHLHIPGIDMLFNTPEEFEHEQFGFDLIVKEVSSAAVQTGKKRIMSETHGAGGWDVTFKDQKRMLDWQFALGINYVVPHLFYLSMQGERKRDFPLSFINEPWWGEYRILADYIARLSYLLSEGDFIADTMVLHNCSSTLAAYSPLTDNKALNDMGEETRETVVALSAGQVYYNLGSEILLERHGAVQDGAICIGGMRYKYLVLPPSITIQPSTLALISDFAQQGGFIVCTGRKPNMVNGQISQELITLLADVPTVAISDVAAVLKEKGAASLPLTPVDKASADQMHSVYVHERRIDGKRLLFICNISRYHQVEFTMPANGLISEYDSVAGSIKELAYDGDSIKVTLPACGSVCYMIDTTAAALRFSKPLHLSKPAPQDTVLAKYDRFTVSRERDNMLAINTCTVKLDDGWEENGMATAIEQKLRGFFNQSSPFTRRQPYMYTEEEKAKKLPFRAQYTFTAAGEITRLQVAAEYPEDFAVSLNGVTLSPEGYFADRDIVMYPASHAVKKGENVIELNGQYHVDTTVESIFVFGDFTVECTESGYILNSDAMPGLGDATQQGHPFYCGKLSYETEIDIEPSAGTLLALLDGFHGTVAKVYLNGKPAATLGWEPYEADITELAVPGKNTLRVDVYSSAQNIFGPHAKIAVPGLVTPNSFNDPDDGVFFSYGLYEGVSLIRRA